MPYADVGIERIYYEDAGAGPALLLLHSLGASSHAWAGQIAALRDRYRVIAPDCRGHGRSSHRGTITLDSVVDDLVGLLDHLDVDRAHVAGLSMGGMWALRLYERAPERVRSLVLADTFSNYGAEAGCQRVESLRKTFAEVSMTEYARTYTAQTLLPTTPPEHHAQLIAAIGAMDPQAYLETAAACFLSDLDHVLPRVRVPTLVVIGAEDRKTPLPMSEKLAAGIPGAKLATVPDAAHLVNLDNPDGFQQVLTDFLARAGRD